MSLKDEIPSPFKSFVGILLLQGSIFAFFVENKQQTLSFYLLSITFLLLNSLACALLVGMVKRPGTPFIFSLDAPDHVVSSIFAERRRERWKKNFQMAVVFFVWIVIACFVALKMYSLFQIKLH